MILIIHTHDIFGTPVGEPMMMRIAKSSASRSRQANIPKISGRRQWWNGRARRRVEENVTLIPTDHEANDLKARQRSCREARSNATKHVVMS